MVLFEHPGKPLEPLMILLCLLNSSDPSSSFTRPPNHTSSWQRMCSNSRKLSFQHCKNDPKRMYSNQCCVYMLITHRHDLCLSCPSSHPRKILSVSVSYSTSQSILKDTTVLAPFQRWKNHQMKNQVTFKLLK